MGFYLGPLASGRCRQAASWFRRRDAPQQGRTHTHEQDICCGIRETGQTGTMFLVNCPGRSRKCPGKGKFGMWINVNVLFFFFGACTYFRTICTYFRPKENFKRKQSRFSTCLLLFSTHQKPLLWPPRSVFLQKNRTKDSRRTLHHKKSCSNYLGYFGVAPGSGHQATCNLPPAIEGKI